MPRDRLERIDDFRATEAVNLIRRNGDILTSEILSPARTIQNPLRQSALIELIINCYELTKICEAFDRKILADHDTPQNETVATLIAKFRNSVVHTSTTHAKFVDDKMNRFSIVTVADYDPESIRIDDVSLGCAYADDQVFISGSMVLYYFRHLVFVTNVSLDWFRRNTEPFGVMRYNHPVVDELVNAEIQRD